MQNQIILPKFLDKLKIWFLSLLVFPKLPVNKIVRHLAIPLDFIRFDEFYFILSYLKSNSLSKKAIILDVSSPYALSYLLTEFGKVIKTDINPKEKLAIKESKNLSFKLEDAIDLSFEDNQFDLTCSISVIEHIHNNYLKAVSEMARVTKNDGLIYLTFPVSSQHTEEWVNEDIYAKQVKKDTKTFFQYRFNENDFHQIINTSNTKVVFSVVQWENTDGKYDNSVAVLKQLLSYPIVGKVAFIFVNLWVGLTILSSKKYDQWPMNKKFGNAHVLLRKTIHG